MKNKISLMIIIFGLVVGIGIVFIGSSKTNKNSQNIKYEQKSQTENTEIKEGIQYITIEARGGYSPRITKAKAGIPTKLIVKTDGTYDCSSALVIKSLNYKKILPKTGEEIIDLGIPKAGTPIGGTCGMGMYSFMVNFE